MFPNKSRLSFWTLDFLLQTIAHDTNDECLDMQLFGRWGKVQSAPFYVIFAAF